jgi:hypothetical protein
LNPLVISVCRDCHLSGEAWSGDLYDDDALAGSRIHGTAGVTAAFAQIAGNFAA